MKLIELVTDDSNVVLQPAYVLGMVAFVVGIGLQIYSVVKGTEFDAQAYGLGIGALIAGIEGGKKLGGG